MIAARTPAQTVDIRTARQNDALSRAPIERPTSASAAKAKPSSR